MLLQLSIYNNNYTKLHIAVRAVFASTYKRGHTSDLLLTYLLRVTYHWVTQYHR